MVINIDAATVIAIVPTLGPTFQLSLLTAFWYAECSTKCAAQQSAVYATFVPAQLAAIV